MVTLTPAAAGPAAAAPAAAAASLRLTSASRWTGPSPRASTCAWHGTVKRVLPLLLLLLVAAAVVMMMTMVEVVVRWWR